MELGDLNQEQRLAVEHDQGPMLVVAGAGTGKTQVITRRIAHLIVQKKALSSEIVALTFTDKAAREMEERVDQLLPYGMVDTRIMTFHAFGDRLLQQYVLEIGLDPGYVIMSSAQQLVFLREHIDELNLDYLAPINNPDGHLSALAGYFSRLKDELISPRQYQDYASKLPGSDDAEKLAAKKQLELANAYGTYVGLCRKLGYLDFGDQIQLVIELFEQRPNVLIEVRKEIKYLLVDEFQDTNLAQNRLLELLTGENGNLMVVGDDDQSIYKFRGASISNILSFVEHYPKAKQVVLTQNYRSTQEILDSAYKLIQHNNPDRLEVKNQINKYLTASSNGAVPNIMVASTFGLEADLVAGAIKERLARRGSPSQIAILVRKRTQAEVIAQALAAQKIPHRFSGSQSLYKQSEIEIMLQFLQCLVDPTDSVSLYHLLAGPVYGFDLTHLMGLAASARSKNQTLENILRTELIGNNDFDSRQAAFWQQIDGWRQFSINQTVGQMAFMFLQDTGYLRRLTEVSKTDPTAENQVRNLAKFFGLLSDYERVATDKSSLAYILALSALRQAGEDAEAGESDGLGDEVQVMTVHKAKGLEFETVYLFDLTKGAFPSNRRTEPIVIPTALLDREVLPEGDWHIQEERRLMYVAMTRAKNELVMTYSPDHGGKLPKKPSPFLHEALGVEPPQLETKPLASALQQIELFKSEGNRVILSKPNFFKGDKLFLTPHQIDDYLTCPENFHYNYVLEVPKPPEPNLMYGSLIHAIINHYYLRKAKGNVELAELLDMVPKLWRSEGFISLGQEQRRLEQAKKTLKSFYQREEKAHKLPRYTEQKFKFELADIKVVVSGRYDAIFESSNGEVEIRDYKTSQVTDQKKADDKAKTSVQLAIYALAWEKTTGKLPDRVVLDFVETGQIGTAVKTQADSQKMVADIARVASGIRSGEFGASRNCIYCSHQKVGSDA